MCFRTFVVLFSIAINHCFEFEFELQFSRCKSAVKCSLRLHVIEYYSLLPLFVIDFEWYRWSFWSIYAWLVIRSFFTMLVCVQCDLSVDFMRVLWKSCGKNQPSNNWQFTQSLILALHTVTVYRIKWMDSNVIFSTNLLSNTTSSI